MRRVVLLAVLALALPIAAFADSVTDYAIFGTTSAGTATFSGVPPAASGTISVTSALFAINGVSQPAGGTISLTTGSVMVLNGITFINAVGNKVSVTLQIGHGAVSGDTFVTPEPGTLGLLGT